MSRFFQAKRIRDGANWTADKFYIIEKVGSIFKYKDDDGKLWTADPSDFLVKFDYTSASKDENNMLETIKSKALELREVTKPFEKYLVIALALYLVDYFIFKGKYTDKLLSIASKVFEKAASTLETGLNKILGE